MMIHLADALVAHRAMMTPIGLDHMALATIAHQAAECARIDLQLTVEDGLLECLVDLLVSQIIVVDRIGQLKLVGYLTMFGKDGHEIRGIGEHIQWQKEYCDHHPNSDRVVVANRVIEVHEYAPSVESADHDERYVAKERNESQAAFAKVVAPANSSARLVAFDVHVRVFLNTL